MWWFKKSVATKNDINRLNNVLENSFSNVKSNTDNIFQWLNYFNLKIHENDKTLVSQQKIIQHLNDKISSLPLSKYEIKELMDEHYAFKKLLSKIRDLDSQIEGILSGHTPLKEKISSLHERIDDLAPLHEKVKNIHSRLESIESPTPSSSFKEKLIQKISRNSKSYVKNLIISLIHKYESISSLKLREIVVEEQGLCSKSSFYRILVELEESGDAEVLKQGSEKIFLTKLSKHA